jgi:hypothetical protein
MEMPIVVERVAPALPHPGDFGGRAAVMGQGRRGLVYADWAEEFRRDLGLGHDRVTPFGQREAHVGHVESPRRLQVFKHDIRERRGAPDEREPGSDRGDFSRGAVKVCSG